MTNDNNPFGDFKLTETFVWEKKLEKEGLVDIHPEKLKMLTAQRVEENKVIYLLLLLRLDLLSLFKLILLIDSFIFREN